MRTRIAVIGLTLSLTNAFAGGRPKVPVTVIQNIPTTVSYDQQLSGRSIHCDDTSCSAFYMPAGTGTLDLRGAHLQLLLPAGEVVVAECLLKTEKASYFLEAMVGGAASLSYRGCLVPQPTSTVEVQIDGTKVKLFIRTQQPDGSSRQATETYTYKGTLKHAAQTVLSTSNSYPPRPEPSSQSAP